MTKHIWTNGEAVGWLRRRVAFIESKLEHCADAEVFIRLTIQRIEAETWLIRLMNHKITMRLSA